jgi:peptidoglycan/xylan/chitin deacetylase (PgdA/CDA1 family)
MTKKLFRRLFFTAIRVTGIQTLWRWHHRDHITILTLHGVMDPSVGNTNWEPLRWQMQLRQLDKYLEILTQYFDFVSMDTAVRQLASKAPKSRKMKAVLTFDDGYRNSYTQALPILNKHGVPGIVFPAVSNVIKQEPFWFDRLDYALQMLPAGEQVINIGSSEFRVNSDDRSDLQRQCKRIMLAAKDIDDDDLVMQKKVRDLTELLEAKSGKTLQDIHSSDEWTALCTGDMLKKSVETGLDVGSHTMDHIRLSQVADDVIVDQLSQSKHELEAIVNQSCKYICYPNGDYDDRVRAHARACGYEAGLTTDEGINGPGAELYRLRRNHLPKAAGSSELIAVASGLSFAMSTIKTNILKFATSIFQVKANSLERA